VEIITGRTSEPRGLLIDDEVSCSLSIVIVKDTSFDRDKVSELNLILSYIVF